MTPAEAVRLCRIVSACCPQQKLDDATPQVWGDLLEGIPYGDAESAVKELAKRQPFIAPSEIITEVKRIRSRRIEDHPIYPPPGLDPDDVAGYQRWLAESRTSVGNGAQPRPPLQLTTGHTNEITSKIRAGIRAVSATFKRPPPANTPTRQLAAEQQRQLAELDQLIKKDTDT